MSISKGFRESLEKLEFISQEKCTCGENIISCRKCFADQELHACHERLDEVLNTLEFDFKK